MHTMRKMILAVLCGLMMPLIAVAADKRPSEASVHGHVIDKNSGEHVPFLVVSLKGTTVGTTTGDSGHYFLEHLPEGTFVLQVSGVGYKMPPRISLKFSAAAGVYSTDQSEL